MRARERDRCSSRKYNLGLKEEANVAGALKRCNDRLYSSRLSRLISLSLVVVFCLLSFLPAFLSFFLSFPPSFTSPPPPPPFIPSLAHFAFQLALSLHGNSTRPTAPSRSDVGNIQIASADLTFPRWHRGTNRQGNETSCQIRQ